MLCTCEGTRIGKGKRSGPASACYSPCSWQHLAKVAPPPPPLRALAKKRERFLHPRQQQISLASFHFGSVNIQERTFSSGAVKSLRKHAQGPANIFAASKIHFCWCHSLLLRSPLGTKGEQEKKTHRRSCLFYLRIPWTGVCMLIEFNNWAIAAGIMTESPAHLILHKHVIHKIAFIWMWIWSNNSKCFLYFKISKIMIKINFVLSLVFYMISLMNCFDAKKRLHYHDIKLMCLSNCFNFCLMY